MKIVTFIKKDKKILIKILLAKLLVLFFLFLVRPPTTMISDAEIYYKLTIDPTKMFRPPGSQISEDIFLGKPVGWPTFLYIFYVFYNNWIFWALFFSFVFSFLALYILYLTTNEKIMWLFFFYPYFLYHSNFPLEVSIFSFLVVVVFYFLKKNNFLSNLISNISSFFRPEGILISFYILLKKVEIKNILLFVTTTCFVLYIYAYSYVVLNYYVKPPLIAYPRLLIPFLIPLFVEYQKFFTKHFWKIMIIWFILGASIGFFKVFYIWSFSSEPQF